MAGRIDCRLTARAGHGFLAKASSVLKEVSQFILRWQRPSLRDACRDCSGAQMSKFKFHPPPPPPTPHALRQATNEYAPPSPPPSSSLRPLPTNGAIFSPSIGKSIRVRLRGEGVRPVLTMEPADGHLDMGYVLAGDSVQR